MSYRVAIRTRAALDYGWGHLMRARRLRDQLRRQDPDVSVCLAVEGDEGVRSARQAWQEDWIELEAKDEEGWIDEARPDALVVDLLEPETKQHALWREGVSSLVLFDDLGNSSFEVDLLIRPQSLDAGAKESRAARCLEGLDYFIVDPDLTGGAETVRRRVESVLVVLGGCLPPPVEIWMRGLIDELADAPFHTTLLTGFDSAGSLDELADDDRLTIVRGSQDVASHMKRADLAIAAGGYVKFELAAAGTPALLVAIVDHQQELARRFADATGAARYLGPIAERSGKEVLQGAIDLSPDQGTRQRMSDAGRQAVDGRGAERVANAILEMAGK